MTPRRVLATVAVAVVAGALAGSAAAQEAYPDIPVWAYAGAYTGPGADSVAMRPRTMTVRWLRDPAAEARPDFAGYRIYRITAVPDTVSPHLVLIRRYSKQYGDSLFLWHLPRLNPADTALAKRVATFIDPDSNGRFVKVCRQVDHLGRCLTRGDSIFKLVPPPGPHDGFRTWYSITYEARNTTSNDYIDLFVPDLANCQNPSEPTGCPNLNHKAANLSNDVAWPQASAPSPDDRFFSRPVEPTRGPTADLELVSVVPNPYRGAAQWDRPGESELHFINLPSPARVRIFTVAGDLVAELHHENSVSDFARWDLRNQTGRDVSSGVYLYRVEAGTYSFQGRFVVIR